MFIAVLVLCFFVYVVDGQERGRSRPGGWAGYVEAPGLRGWLGLRREPRDWSAAAADCLREDAALASPWSPDFSAAAGALAAREGLPMLYSGARATLPFIAGGGGAGADSSPGELVRCSAFLADGSSTDVPCTARLPYVCYAADPGPASRLWPGYEYSAALRGWLKLHSAPRDWSQARIACHLEGAFLTAPWSPEFTSAMRALAARAPPRAVHASIRVRQNYADAAYSYVDGAPVLSVEPAALLRREACITLHANGTERELSCKERLPFVCYAPLPTAPTPTPGSAPSELGTSPSPSPLPLRPTTETDIIRTLRTVPTTSSSPITNPTTTTTTTLVSPTTTDASKSTAVSTTSTTTLAPTTKPTPVPTTSTTSTAPVPTTISSTHPSDGASPTTAAPFNVCEEMGLVEYRWEEVTEQCYRFHPFGATWPVANETCVREGAALAVANSREEAMLFTRMLLQHLKSGIRDAKFEGAVALGFYWDQEWKTVDGTPLEETGYAKWWPGWPRDQELARWGFMEHTGRLENYVGTVTTPFICEALL